MIWVRDDFPILLRRREDGKPIIYLDSAATSLKPKAVIDEIVRYYKEYTANVHRGVTGLAQEATESYEDAREDVAKFIGAEDAERIVFTKNTTDSINLVANALDWRDGDEIVLSVMEHHSNLVPWLMVKKRHKVALRFIDLDEENAHLNLDMLDELLSKRTKLLAISHASNVLGTINPVYEMVKRAHEVGALVLIDGAQSVPHMRVNVKELGCDLFAFSGHKMLGPTGIGVLYVREGVEDHLSPPYGGGGMIRQVDLDKFEAGDMPWRFEAGTPNIAGAIGLRAAVRYLTKLGMDRVREHERNLTEYALNRLLGSDEVTVYGPKKAEERCGIISFSVRGATGHEVALMLDELENIVIRSGKHCTQPLHRKLGVSDTARASFYIYNTKDEVDIFCETLSKVIRMLGP
jgi:cysteine desulfurase/selenocysteine lyase